MSNQPPVFVALDHATDVARTLGRAASIAGVSGADVHAIEVVPRRAAHARDDEHGIGARLASMPRAADDHEIRVRSITLRGTPELALPAYAQLHQPTLLVVERDYGSSPLWRSVGVVDALARRSPVPLLVLPRREWGEPEPPTLRRILTAVDTSVASAVALRTAIELSRRDGARVILLHALTTVSPHMVVSGSEALELVRRLPAQKEAIAERLRRKAAFFGGDAVETAVVTGVAAGAIVDMAARCDADLVVMGVAARAWLDRLLFGSTLRRVLRRAHVPVLVVPVVAGADTWPDESAVEERNAPRGQILAGSFPHPARTPITTVAGPPATIS